MTRIFALAFVMLIALASRGQSLVITTVAGGGIGDHGAALNANLNTPAAMAFDAAGNLYIADQGFNRIRRVDHDTGIITTYAGNGQPGFSGDGGPASSAMLSSPGALVVDAQGNLYIADSGNDRVRRIDAATGIISTIAGGGDANAASAVGDGGPATSAVLAYPSAIALGPTSAHLYVADQYHARVRRVDLASGSIETIAGNGRVGYSGDGGPALDARLNNPTGVAVASNGDVYIADRNNRRIRKLAAGTGLITTVAGGAPLDEFSLIPDLSSLPFADHEVQATDAALMWPQGVALDAAGKLFIADSIFSLVMRVDASSGVISSVGRLYGGFPTSMAFDAAGNLFVNDEAANVVSRLSLDGTTQDVAGNAEAGFAGDGGNAMDAALGYPTTLAFGPAGQLYMIDVVRIRQVDPNGIISTIAGGGPLSSARCPPSQIPSTSLRLYPTALASARSGLLYVGMLNGVVCTLDHDHKFHAFAGDPFGNYIDFYGDNGDGHMATVASIASVDSLALDSTGDVFIGDGAVGRVRIVRVQDGIIDTFAGNGTVGNSGDGGPARQAMLGGPLQLALDARFLYVSDAANNRVRRVDLASGVITTIAGNGSAGFSGDGGPASEASLSGPQGIALDAVGNLYIADSANNRVRKVLHDSGVIVTIVGTGAAGFSGDGGDALQATLDNPTGLAFDAMGILYVSDSNNARVRKLTPGGSP